MQKTILSTYLRNQHILQVSVNVDNLPVSSSLVRIVVLRDYINYYYIHDSIIYRKSHSIKLNLIVSISKMRSVI